MKVTLKGVSESDQHNSEIEIFGIGPNTAVGLVTDALAGEVPGFVATSIHIDTETD